MSFLNIFYFIKMQSEFDVLRSLLQAFNVTLTITAVAKLILNQTSTVSFFQSATIN